MIDNTPAGSNKRNTIKVTTRSSDIEDSPINDRYAEGMHAVPPPMTRIYIPSGPDIEINESQFTYGPNEETFTFMPELVVNEPKVVSQPKVWSDAPIIEEYESDSDDEHVSLPIKEQETPCFDFVNTVKHVKTPRQTVKVDMGLGYWLSMDLRNSYLCLLKFFNLTLRHCQKRRSYQSDGKLLEILTFIYNRHFKKDIRYNSSGSLETLLELHDVLYVVVRGEACFYGSFEPAGIKNLHHYL
ncbi:hypothetical protein Tco_1234560 [Tanacetum coccineum]